ncbi:Uma2 family endonuclease [Streptomyces xiaopingdaonensis]|uniref:Uma2 family endonuclease n=1 Tax=Streptomyces xiaopingdaonensis TaxID=1565415 RepID=UPI0002E9A9AD|nr:Uma2 family endonuclease [Streptomyces xiaopingdaonensis]
MSAAPVEFPPDDGASERPPSLTEAADAIAEAHPGYRAEIVGGILTVTPPPDVPHSRVLSRLMRPFFAAGLDDEGGETEVHQGIGVWLPGEPTDYAIPDLAVVDSDIDEHVAARNCADPGVFRLVLEVTSENHNNDLRLKALAYARAGIPVYTIVDRRHGRLHILTEPADGEYQSHRLHAPGEQAVLPESIGAKVSLDVAQILDAGKNKRA